jgi:hypothetical protein
MKSRIVLFIDYYTFLCIFVFFLCPFWQEEIKKESETAGIGTVVESELPPLDWIQLDKSVNESLGFTQGLIRDLCRNLLNESLKGLPQDLIMDFLYRLHSAVCLGIQPGSYLSPSRFTFGFTQEDSRSWLLKSPLEDRLQDSDGDLFKDSLRVFIGSPTHFRVYLIDRCW